MIMTAPWLAPFLSWVIALTLLCMVLIVVYRRESVGYQEVLAILLGSLALALAGATTAMLSLFPSGTFDLEIVGIELATLRGLASAMFLGVLLHMTNPMPHLIKRVDNLFKRLPVLRHKKVTPKHR